MDMNKLADLCKCGLPIGKHTVAEWFAHVGETTEAEWEQFDRTLDSVGLDLTFVNADTIDIKALAIDSPDLVDVMPAIGLVEMTFQTGNPVGPNQLSAKVRYLGTPSSLRAAGKLLRDAFNRAANVAEGAR
jgi:hypothetical protein